MQSSRERKSVCGFGILNIQTASNTQEPIT